MAKSFTWPADRFLDCHKPSYIGGILEMANARFYPFWGHLTEALRVSLRQECVPKIIRIIATHSGSRSGISPFRRASA